MCKGLAIIPKRNWRFHGLRHGCANNLHGLSGSNAMSTGQIADWYRMSLWILQYYLKHNREGVDPTNRTDEIPGCNTLSLDTVAAWCAQNNSTVSPRSVRALFEQLQCGSVENFVGIKFEALENEIQKDGFNVAIGMRYVVLDAHKSFSELLRNGNNEQIEAVVSEVSLDGDIDGIYQAASMGLQTAEADRRAAREVEA